MEIVVKDEPIQTHETSDTRELYKALGKLHLHDYEMRRAKIAAKEWREIVAKKGRRPGGFGIPVLTLPNIVVDHYREGRKEMYLSEPEKFWCWLWHRFPDFRCSNDKKCLYCGRG